MQFTRLWLSEGALGDRGGKGLAGPDDRAPGGQGGRAPGGQAAGDPMTAGEEDGPRCRRLQGPESRSGCRSRSGARAGADAGQGRSAERSQPPRRIRAEPVTRLCEHPAGTGGGTGPENLLVGHSFHKRPQVRSLTGELPVRSS